jgi:AcrR family transcriptional regulator
VDAERRDGEAATVLRGVELASNARARAAVPRRERSPGRVVGARVRADVDRSVKTGDSLTSMTRKLTPRGEERRAQLLATATRLFAERGYDPTSVADIVAAMGVGKGVFYWYFPSKEELLAEILRSSQLQVRRAQQAAIADEPDPVRRIELGIRATLAWFRDHREYFAILQLAGADERFAPALRRNREVAIADTMRHLKEAIVEGRIADVDPELLAHSIHGVVDQLTRRCLIERDDDLADVADVAVRFCLHGLRGLGT